MDFFFPWNPGGMAAVAAAFAILAVVMRAVRRFRGLPVRGPVIASVTWALAAVWEYYCQAEHYNIRVDILLLYPALFAVTLTAVLSAAGRPLTFLPQVPRWWPGIRR
jgi:hypothetical protein